MVIDTSAIIAILWSEADASRFAEAIEREANCCVSAATYVELAIVADGAKRPTPARDFDLLFERGGIRVEPFTPGQAQIARQAHQRYGRGSGHPARLNFGDCFSYALAVDLGHPLLFKGGDFAQTDVVPALA
ncbi:MAG: type II toxin-antitoxin system VapC family toxin [Thermoleophilales bacterium]|nr:type II toxin-antitoxin system VapC family toxin [Thermoleophilales bacterium]